MSSQASVPPPFQQWQQFFPSSAGSYPYGGDMLNEQIYAAVTGNAEAAKQQFSNDIARDTLRAIDRNGQDNMSTSERTAAQLGLAVERNGSQGTGTTERTAAQITAAVERNGSLNYGAIERVAGENRLTTVVTDSASRQAANDSARDILRAVDRNESTTIGMVKDTHNGLLGAIERNAGENRMTTVTTSGHTDARMTDVRHAVIGEVNRATNELLSNLRNNHEATTTGLQVNSTELRQSLATGFSSQLVESLKSAGIAALQSAQDTAQIMSSQQQLSAHLTGRIDSQFAINQLEMQKVKEGLATQAAYNYSVGQLEAQKIKEGLAQQASTHFAINQLEQQKVKECLSAQLSDAKYEALKSQQYLTDKMSECCCEVKQKIDLIDRDRLRDNLTTQKEETNLFKMMEIGALGGFGGGFGGNGGHGGHGGYGRRGDRGDGRRR